jgi:hypothetical protein
MGKADGFVTRMRRFVTEDAQSRRRGRRIVDASTSSTFTQLHAMKNTIRLAAMFLLSGASASTVAGMTEWLAPQDPFAIYGNTY